MPALLRRFDLGSNGMLDMQDWTLARSAARREVEKMRGEAEAQADINIISRPRNGELFLVSNLNQARLLRRYLLWNWAHLLIFFAALGGIEWIMQATDF